MADLDMAIYAQITEAFLAAKTPDGKIDAVKLGEAAKLIAPLYDRIFGKGYVSDHLKADLVGHGSGLVKAASADLSKFQCVDAMIPLMVQQKGVQNIRGKWGEGVIECLWTKRALDFIMKFLEYSVITYPELTLHQCGSKAYDEVLKPYHGWMVSTIVGLAFNLAPSRQNFLKALGFKDIEAAKVTLVPFLEAAKPVLVQVHQVLEQNGCNFPDKV